MTLDANPIELNQIILELSLAEDARARGNEGMARVCCRRAAGIAIGEYLYRHGYTGFGSSAYERITILKTLPNIKFQATITAEHLLLRVNEDHELPIDLDLIQETRWLIFYLLPDIKS